MRVEADLKEVVQGRIDVTGRREGRNRGAAARWQTQRRGMPLDLDRHQHWNWKGET